MKVNTKTMTPISKIAPITMKSAPGSCLFNPNKYIEDGASTLNKVTDENEDPTPFGSLIRYIPTIFYTPVKSSSRLESKGTLSADGVQDLSKAFEQLLINAKDEEEEKTESPEEEENTEEETEVAVEVESAAEVEGGSDDVNEQTEKLGRFKTRDTTLKSAPKKVDVIRSYRLVDDEQ